MEKNNNNITRKEFLTGMGRIFMLLIILFIPGYLVSKKKVSREGSECDIDLQCNTCDKKNKCNLIKSS